MSETRRRASSRSTASRSEVPPRQDDFYRQLRERLTNWARKNEIDPAYRDYLLAVPDLFHFLCRMALDSRVRSRDKALLGMAVAYVISPVDLLPEVLLGPFGYVDDLIVMVMVLDSVLKRTPQGVVDDHWAGERDLYALIRESLAKADGWVGKGMFRRIREFLRKQGIWPAEATTAEPPPVPEPDVVPAVRRGESSSRSSAGSSTAASKKKASKKKPAKKKATKKAPSKKASSKKAASKKAGSKKTQARRTIAPRRPADPERGEGET